jgi:hypothetical protein
LDFERTQKDLQALIKSLRTRLKEDEYTRFAEFNTTLSERNLAKEDLSMANRAALEDLRVQIDLSKSNSVHSLSSQIPNGSRESGCFCGPNIAAIRQLDSNSGQRQSQFSILMTVSTLHFLDLWSLHMFENVLLF